MNPMHRLYHDLRQFQIALKKGAARFRDSFSPDGHVEATLFYADGPNKGKVYRTMKGRNIVTSTPLAGGGFRGGRDMMRRLIINPSEGSSFKATPGIYVGNMILGTKTDAETVTDTIETMTPVTGSVVAISSVSLDVANPHVTFTANWNQNQGNATNISEAGLLSARTPYDMFARKTFTPFTKTTDFTLQINWTLRF